MKLINDRLPIRGFVVMMQKEVADRITAKPGTKEYGSLSIAIQYYCTAEVAMIVPKTVFMPQPNVDSAVIRLIKHDKPPVTVISEDFLFEVTRTSFAQRRKTILNNLQAGLQDGKKKKEMIIAALEASGIEPTRRGETLTIEEFGRLADALHPNFSKQ